MGVGGGRTKRPFSPSLPRPHRTCRFGSPRRSEARRVEVRIQGILTKGKGARETGKPHVLDERTHCEKSRCGMVIAVRRDTTRHDASAMLCGCYAGAGADGDGDVQYSARRGEEEEEEAPLRALERGMIAGAGGYTYTYGRNMRRACETKIERGKARMPCQGAKKPRAGSRGAKTKKRAGLRVRQEAQASSAQ